MESRYKNLSKEAFPKLLLKLNKSIKPHNLIKSFMAWGIYPPDATQIKREKIAPGVIFGEEEPMKNEAINSGIVKQKQRSGEATDIGLNESVKEKDATDELTNQNVSTENIEPKEADETVKDYLNEFRLAEPLTPKVLKNTEVNEAYTSSTKTDIKTLHDLPTTMTGTPLTTKSKKLAVTLTPLQVGSKAPSPVTPRTKLTKAFLAHFRVNLRNSKAKSSRRIKRESLTEEESVKRLRMEEEA